MTPRERFLEVMNFNTHVPTLKWEFGYWGGTVDRWYREGLQREKYARIPETTTTPTASLYLPAWNYGARITFPNGYAVMAGGLYWPTQGFALDNDIRRRLNMDPTQILVDVNLLFDPMFEVRTVEETRERLVYVDIDGVERIFQKKEATIPTMSKGPIDGWDSWRKLKDERLNLKNISGRFPKNWPELVQGYKNRDYPLAIGGYPHGFFGTLAHLLGYERLFYWYHDEPELLHDILNTFTDLWIAVYSEVLSQVEVDHLHVWEDVSAGTGPMISLDTVKAFMLPYYRRLIDFLKGRGIKIFLVDTDGDCNSLIPLFMSAGVTGMYPFEVHCGMDIVKVRQEYPTLQMFGGVPKAELCKGNQRVNEILEPVKTVLKTGGYVPFADHFVPPDVPWHGFRYYRTRLNELIDAAATSGG